MLLALLVDGDAFEHHVAGVVGLERAGLEDRVDHGVLLHAALDDVHPQVEVAGHLDRAAEGDLAVALREVDVAHRQAAAVDVDGEVDLRAAGEVLDVAVAAVLTRGHGASAFLGGRLAGFAGHPAHVGGVGVGQRRERRDPIGLFIEQPFFAFVPDVQQLFAGQAADQPGVHDASELDAGDVPGVGVDPAEVPAGLAGVGEVLIEEAAAVFQREDAGEAPFRVRQYADVEDVDHQQVARLSALHADRAREVVHLREVDFLDVHRRVVVFDLAPRPVDALDAELIAGLDRRHHRDVGVPAVVQDVLLFRGFRNVDFDQRFHREMASFSG